MATVVTDDCLRQPDFLAPSDRIEHLPFLFWLVPALAPGVAVDLGAGPGTSYFALCQAVAEAGLATRCLAVDDWSGPEADAAFHTVLDHNARHYAEFSQIRAGDPGAGPASDLPGPVALLLVGGDSAEAGFAAWSGALAPGAVVLIHGTAEGGGMRLWQRLSAIRPAIEFPHGGGLGVVAAGAAEAPGLAGLFAAAADPEEAQHWRETFARLGRGLAAELERDDLRVAFEALKAGTDAEIARLRDSQDRETAELAALRRDLAGARRRPLRTLADYLTFRLLAGLARLSPPLPAQRAARFARSAAKRDPARSLGPGAAPEDAGGTVRLAPAAAARAPDPARPTVLVVSHEASLTGAPVLAWNLAETLSGTCNVVTLTLKGGPLGAAFRTASVAFYETDRKAIGAGALRRMVREICARHGIDYALVNSVQSRAVLPALRAAGVPSVALIHEFASNIRPPGAMADVIRDADQVVFSTRMTLENAATTCGLGRGAAIHVLPQGKCRVPATDPAGEPAAERRRLDALLRPGGAEAGSFVVIGAGAIEPRKGVDLFIECATRLCSAPGGGRFRFVWIGAGFDPETDNRGSMLLADQIARAGIGAQMTVIPPTGEIEHAYRQADLLLLTSRLDPLPNVAIDALVAGTPVVCFARTTGIADVLAEAGLGAACVARYLDTADMAAKVRALAGDDAFRAGIARQGEAAAAARFDFPHYAGTLQALAGSVEPRARQIEADSAAIAASGAFRPDFFRPRPRDRDTADAAIADYVRASWEGAALRKPMPGFNPAIFAERSAPEGGEPFLRFLKAGRPAGPWSFPVVTPDSPDALPAAPLRVALQIHAFYLDEVGAILERLMRNRSRPDLFVSTPPGQVDAARAAFAAYDGRVAAVEPVPNRGRDIAPWLVGFGPRLVEGYDVIGHVHTKKTLDFGTRRSIDAWKDFLSENLLGGMRGGAMLDRILAAMAADPTIALVFPDDPNVIGWGANRAIAETLAGRMGIDLLPDQFDFPVGSMAWMRAGLFRQFVALGLDWGDYPVEPVPHDGTVLHALERLFGAVPAVRGLTVAVTNVPGLSR